MKIERLTENKIRVLINSSDFDIENVDITAFLSQTLEDNFLLSNILKKANDEIGFNTDGCKLLIESFLSSENILVFTITKYAAKVQKKKLMVKRKIFSINGSTAVFKFDSFEDFCLLCERIDDDILYSLKKIIKKNSLYCYHDTYYLIFKDIDVNNKFFSTLYFLVLEFAIPLANSSNFESKLLEHGKIIIKNNAILTGIKYFVSKSLKPSC